MQIISGWRWYVVYRDGCDADVKAVGKLREWEVSARQELEARFASWPNIPGMTPGASVWEWGVEWIAKVNTC